jgi:hypothetical protein
VSTLFSDLIQNCGRVIEIKFRINATVSTMCLISV